MAKDLLARLAAKEISRDELLRMVESDRTLLPTVVSGVGSPKAAVRYSCARVLMDLSEPHPDWLYPHMEYFIGLLDSRYRPLLWGALLIIANLTRVDKEKIFDANFSKYFASLDDGYMVTAANVAGNSGRIARAKPYLANRVADELLRVDDLVTTPHLTAECKRVIAEHAIRSLDSFFDLIDDKERVLSFVKRHTDSPRGTLREEARAFLERRDPRSVQPTGGVPRPKFKGCTWRIVPIKHLAELKRDIGDKVREGQIDLNIYKDYLKFFNFNIPRELKNARSLVVAAVPQPAIRLTFRHKGREWHATVPPTYVDNQEIDRFVVSELKKAYGKRHRLVRVALPSKHLAARSGLTKYGRNNITSIPTWGSFCRLTSFLSDIDPPDDPWGEPQMLPECKDCRLCMDACPAKVITDDRFMVRAERCLTYQNEKPSEVDFPPWVGPSWHNALIGCMICQRVCPINRGVISWTEDRGDFSEEETAYLLKGDFTRVKRGIKAKLKRAGLDLSSFPRNLRALGLGRQ